MQKLTGYDAINYAENHDVTLNKYNDPTEDAREGLTVEEARKVASEDPNLIYVEADHDEPTETAACSAADHGICDGYMDEARTVECACSCHTGVKETKPTKDDEQIRHGSFGPIVWHRGETRMATQRDMDTLPVGPDLTAEEEEEIED